MKKFENGKVYQIEQGVVNDAMLMGLTWISELKFTKFMYKGKTGSTKVCIPINCYEDFTLKVDCILFEEVK